MAIRHLRDYYSTVCKQYFEMKQNIEDFQKEVTDGMVEPERLEQMNKLAEVVKNNYMFMSWVMFLLDKPNRESKQNKWMKMNKKRFNNLDKSHSLDTKIEENKTAIEVVKNL